MRWRRSRSCCRTGSQYEGEGKDIVVPRESVVVGDLILVRPGERIAVDGTIVSGTASINQAAITGESVPVEKQPGR